MFAPMRSLLLASSLLLVACSSSNPISAGDSGAPDSSAPDSGVPDVGSDAATQGYAVEYVADPAGLHVGKSHFQLKITNKADGTPAAGLASTIQLTPKMTMTTQSMTMSHGAPVPVDAVAESSVTGTYDCTLFFQMASVDGQGNTLGSWTLDVTIGSADTGSIDLTVTPPAGTDTADVMLRNSSDTIAAMGGTKMRPYPLFRDTLAAAQGGYGFTAFLATEQEDAMVWPPVTVGLELVDTSGTVVQLTVQSLDLQASTDGTTWVPMPCDATSRCAATLTGLSQAVPRSVYVKTKINGNDYTTDGNALDPSKNLATFVVTPP